VVREFLIIKLLRVDNSKSCCLIGLFLAQGVFLDESLPEISKLFLFRLIKFNDIALHEASGLRLTGDGLSFIYHFETLWHFREGRRLQLWRVRWGKPAFLLHELMADAVFICNF